MITSPPRVLPYLTQLPFGDQTYFKIDNNLLMTNQHAVLGVIYKNSYRKTFTIPRGIISILGF